MSYRVRPPARPLAGAVTVPGDKSIGHRALILAALGDGRARVSGLGGGQDNQRTVDALTALGVAITPAGPDALVIDGVGWGGLTAPAQPIDCGNSGTSMRLLAGLLAGQPFSSTLDGDRSLRGRPMARVCGPLSAMGARIEGAPGARPGEIYPPLCVAGRRPLLGIDYASPIASAQVKSALLLAGLYAQAPVRVREPAPSRDHTERMLRALGVPVSVPAPGEVVLDPTGFSRRLPARDWQVPGDLSSAAFLLVAGLLVPGSQVTVRGVGLNPTRTGVLDALRAMGADLRTSSVREEGGEPVGDVTARASALHATTLAGTLSVRALDEIPILAVAAACASGTTVVRDAVELRVKESDRISQIVKELARLGVRARELSDGLEIDGPARLAGGVTLKSGGDHRIAMACAVAGLVARAPIEIADVDNVATSFPGFESSLAALGADILKQ
ncbi:MAG TPA: 3-phosphoshikimate 1-carboxyvinyltransferase [Polyangia bacterium]|nr:3-phosphoshikimate 1-carboxyvinyltransferase [Polyangia bacterium]